MRRWAVAAGAVAGAAVALAVGLLLGATVVGDGEPSATAPSTPSGGELTMLSDPAWGFTVGLPPGWRRLAPGDPEILILAAGPHGASLLVRAHSVRLPRSGRLAGVREYARRLVAGQEGVRLLAEPRGVRVGGLPGFAYLYTFRDADSGRRGAHSHVMLVDGDRLLGLVFQAVPARRFGTAAPTFDRILESFRAQRGAQ